MVATDFMDNTWNTLNDYEEYYYSQTGSIRFATIDLMWNDTWARPFHTISSPSEARRLPEEIRREMGNIVGMVQRALLQKTADDVRRPSAAVDKRDSNLVLLSEIKREQAETDDNYVNDTVLGNAARIVFHLDYQPEIFRTFNNSIQMQFETDDMSYLEFEVFENRMTCMLVPKRDYNRATFPSVSLDNTDLMNHIIGELYGVA